VGVAAFERARVALCLPARRRRQRESYWFCAQPRAWGLFGGCETNLEEEERRSEGERVVVKKRSE
jgi:hypothetical protein